MKKGILLGMLLLFVCGLCACSQEEAKEVVMEVVDCSVPFINEMEKDVTALRVRPSDAYEWSGNILGDGAWSDSYSVDVIVSAEVPDAEAGWQVAMTFADNQELVWNDLVMQNGVEYVFSYEADGTPKVVQNIVEYEANEEL